MALTLCVQRTGEVSDILVDRAGGSEDFGGAYGLGKLFTGRLHEGGVEGTSDRKGQGAFGSCFFQGGAGSGNCPGLTGYDDLAVGIVVGRDHYTGDLSTYSLDRPVVEPDDGSHGAGLHLTAALHCACAGGHQTEAILKRHSTGGHEGAEFAQRGSRMAGWVTLVVLRSSSEPSNIMSVIRKPRISLALSIISAALGELSYSSLPMPGNWEPCPGKTNALFILHKIKYFLLLLQRKSGPCSLMDRISDSGSDDRRSIRLGGTIFSKDIFFNHFLRFFKG